jgi:hypothetical protein
MRNYYSITGSTRLPKGIAFDIDDLRLVQGWADSHDVRMVISLDHGVDDEEYEEVISFYPDGSPSCFLSVWRNPGSVFAQPLAGRPLRYRSVSHLLESIAARQDGDETGNAANCRKS